MARIPCSGYLFVACLLVASVFLLLVNFVVGVIGAVLSGVIVAFMLSIEVVYLLGEKESKEERK